MNDSTTKEKVLKNVRDALVNKMPPPYESVDLETPVHASPDSEFPDVSFAEAFSKVNGQFIYCADYEELGKSIVALLRQKNVTRLFCSENQIAYLINSKGFDCHNNTNDLASSQAAITGCEVLISRLGTVVVSSRQFAGRKGPFITPLHIVVANSGQLVRDIKDAFAFLNNKYDGVLPSMITFVTGPSRTADIEKSLVIGAHGPEQLYVFLVEN